MLLLTTHEQLPDGDRGAQSAAVVKALATVYADYIASMNANVALMRIHRDHPEYATAYNLAQTLESTFNATRANAIVTELASQAANVKYDEAMAAYNAMPSIVASKRYVAASTAVDLALQSALAPHLHDELV